MASKYKIFIANAAEEDLHSIADYLINKLLLCETALRQIDRLEKAIASLDEMPERYPLFDNKRWREKNLRIRRVDNYLVFYLVNHVTKNIIIVRVMYKKRNVDSQLFKELEEY